ncbi:MAG: hypothetical protein BWX93_01739 [Bacteroidetes bacterium ADurb.Bin139]|nr:MAG: hypothetical protein BWX93_01739 [Bacteroidetes bacterium ADurb.Bin139]
MFSDVDRGCTSSFPATVTCSPLVVRTTFDIHGAVPERSSFQLKLACTAMLYVPPAAGTSSMAAGVSTARGSAPSWVIVTIASPSCG